MDWVRASRRRQRLSQRALARKAGIAYKTLQLLEGGKHDPRLSTLARIASALGEPVAGLGPAAARTRPDSVAELSARIVQEGEGAWRVRLFDFVDAFRRRPGSDLVAAAPQPAISHRIHALLASTVESLCAEKRVQVPWWCPGVPPLPEPWFVSEVEALKASALVESPAQFRARNIFVLANFLSRA